MLYAWAHCPAWTQPMKSTTAETRNRIVRSPQPNLAGVVMTMVVMVNAKPASSGAAIEPLPSVAATLP